MSESLVSREPLAVSPSRSRFTLVRFCCVLLPVRPKRYSIMISRRDYLMFADSLLPTERPPQRLLYRTAVRRTERNTESPRFPHKSKSTAQHRLQRYFQPSQPSHAPARASSGETGSRNPMCIGYHKPMVYRHGLCFANVSPLGCNLLLMRCDELISDLLMNKLFYYIFLLKKRNYEFNIFVSLFS